MVYEWSGPMHQEVVADWTAITDETALENFTAKLTGRRRRPASPSTALGTALLTGARMLATRRDCAKKTLDISGDGLSNTGPRPQDLGARAELEGVVVNALAVGHGDAEGRATAEQLKAYFERAVIRGPRAFAEPAVDYAAYSEAMRRKLLRELEGAVVSDARP
jgi:hypothetical protein